MSRETDDALRQAIAASLADQASQDADDDLRQALEASKQETPSEPPKDIDALTAQERDALTIDQLNGILKEVETTQPMVGERTGVREALGAEAVAEDVLRHQVDACLVDYTRYLVVEM